jgi:hypothetical protein
MLYWLMGYRPPMESAADKAARKTANATVWLAIFTVVLAVVSSWTLFEIHAGGTDTHNLAVAARDQAAEMKELAKAANVSADAAKRASETAKESLELTKQGLAASFRIVARPIPMGSEDPHLHGSITIYGQNLGHVKASGVTLTSTAVFRRIIGGRKVLPDCNLPAWPSDDVLPGDGPRNETINMKELLHTTDDAAVLSWWRISYATVKTTIYYSDGFGTKLHQDFCDVLIGHPLPKGQINGVEAMDCATSNYWIKKMRAQLVSEMKN